jgi:methylenetetrahydrofolate dehydrogenase (NADP+)/methenyltetrahydrofolate cyclohydrolase
VAQDVQAFRAEHGRAPGLAVIICGRDAPSLVYLERILKGCREVGIDGRFVELEGEATEETVTDAIRTVNADDTVDGIIVQMPLPRGIPLRAVIDAIDPGKDIDGIHPLNAGLLRLGYDGFLPATAHAAIEILRRSDIPMAGRDAVVIGRSPVVGQPAAFLLVRDPEGDRDRDLDPTSVAVAQFESVCAAVELLEPEARVAEADAVAARLSGGV